MGFIKDIATRQLAVSQERLLKRFLSDPDFTESTSRHPMHACLGEWLRDRSGARVLELGCGPGKYVAMLHTLGFKVVGVDPCRFPSWETLRKQTSVTLLDHVVAENLPFSDHCFDHVVCLGALLYFHDVPRAMGEIRRVIKPGGKVLVRTVNKGNLYSTRTGRRLDPASRHLFSMEDLTGLLRDQGFTVEERMSYGFWPPVWPNFWWYLIGVWLPVSLQDYLSSRLRPEYRINNIVVAVA